MALKSSEYTGIIASQYESDTLKEFIVRAKPYSRSFYERNTVKVARDILGSLLVHEIDSEILAGFIVEAEAYVENEEACHAFRGRTPRTEVMFGPGGRAYIYFCYGMYWCLNATAEKEGKAGAVLIRAVEPIMGIDFMKKCRKKDDVKELCSGPGKLTVAFRLDGKLNGWDLSKSPFRVVTLPENFKPRFRVRKTKRIGLKVARDLEYRYHVEGNPYVSR